MACPRPIRLHLVVPLSQPLTAGAAAIDAAVGKLYGPLLRALAAVPAMRVAIHVGGHLLDHLARRHEAWLLALKERVQAGQVEILGGLFYGGVPALLPEHDVRGQVEMAAEFWESVVGSRPRGFWLPALAWSPELPRLLEATGLSYGFASTSQVAGADAVQTGIGSVGRAGHAVAALLLDSELSSGLPPPDPARWVEAAVRRGRRAGGLLSAWVAAESFLPPNGAPPVAAWLAALAGSDQIAPALPGATLATGPRGGPLRLKGPMPGELHALGPAGQAMAWPDFVACYPESDTLHRRMLQASHTLQRAIALMEDENLDDAWSDTLATAQRLLFAAQSPDAYWRGRGPGFGSPALRDATTARVLGAERLIAPLLAGAAAYLTQVEADADGDLVDDVLVSSPTCHAWVLPGRGGEVRTFEVDALGANVLDAGCRRAEPYVGELSCVPPPAGEPWPVEVDAAPRMGTRQWVVPVDVDEHALVTAAAAELWQAPPVWRRIDGGIGATVTAAARFALSVRGEGLLARPEGVLQALEVIRRVHLPADAAALTLAAELALAPGLPARFALELPLRLGTAMPSLTVDGRALPVARGRLGPARRIALRGGDGAELTVTLEGADEVLLLPLFTTLREPRGFAIAAQGLVLMPSVVFTERAALRVTLRGRRVSL